MGIVKSPPQPPSPQLPRPAPLSSSDLHRIPVVCYLTNRTEGDATSRSTSSSSATLVEALAIDPENAFRHLWDDPTRLPVPGLVLSRGDAICAICQEQFVAPQERRAIMLQIEALRQLPCGHVYHVRFASAFRDILLLHRLF